MTWEWVVLLLGTMAWIVLWYAVHCWSQVRMVQCAPNEVLSNALKGLMDND